MPQLGISGLLLVYVRRRMPSVPKVHHAAMAKPSVHQQRDQGGEGVHHTADAQQRRQEHQQHEHGAAQPGGNAEQLRQHGAHTGGHGHHHKEQKYRADGAGGRPQPFDIPRHQQLIHIGAAGHLRQADKQNADDHKQQRRQRKAHIAPVAEGAEKLPKLLPGDKACAQKTADVGKRQRPSLDLFHVSPHVEYTHTI